MLEGLTGIPATDGNQIDILRNGDEIFPAMLDGIRQATRSVDLLTYSWWAGRSRRRSPTAWPSGRRPACGCA